MAYKFQLGAAKLRGGVTSTGVVSGSALSASSPVAVSEGGTGASTAAAALSNLGLSATAAELNVLDGITATVGELNILDGVTADKDELNLLDGVTATTAELNILDGVTATTAELNVLDGVTAGTAAAGKALVLDGGKDATGIRNLTLAGNLTVNGTQTIMNVATMSVQDANIQIANNAAKADGQGLTFGSGSGNQAFFQLSNSAARLSSSLPLTAVQFIGAVVGNADSATVATTVTITDNESTDEENAVIFGAGGDVDGGNLGLESDGNLTYNPSSGRLSATLFAGSGASLTNITADKASSLRMNGANAVLSSATVGAEAVGNSDIVLLDSTENTISVTMPNIQSDTIGRVYIIKDVTSAASASTITINKSAGNHQIDGQDSILLESAHAAVSLLACSASEVGPFYAIF